MSARADAPFVSRAAALAFVLLVVGQPAAAATGVAGVDAADRAGVADSPTIHVDTALSLTPDRPGSIRVVQTFDTPAEVVGLGVTLDPESTVVATDGFSRDADGTWTWDGETEDPTLRYRMAANRTTDRDGPMGADGSYLYADVGEWALVRQPNIGLQWRYRGTDAVDVNRSTRVDGEGAVGEATAFLGPHEVHTREVAEQEIRLIVPAAADLADSPRSVLDGLGSASRALRVGDRDPEVFAVAAPTNRVDWAVQGLQVGDTDFWARDDRTIDGVGSTWIHEYVHTRQSFRGAESGRWFTEASATWYAALLGQQQGEGSYRELASFLERGERQPQSASTLAEPGSWANNANYWKGALVSGELDRRLRLATDGGATLQRVFAALNDRTSPVTNGDILAAVEAASTPAVADTGRRYTTTSDVPAVWSRSAHREAFGGDAALLEVSVDPATDLRATGPYRNASVADPVRLATGESLAVDATAENLGGADGDYTVTLRVDDAAVATANGTLAPGERETVPLSHRFTEPGRYTVSVAGEQFPVRVREPATPTVSDVAVEPTTVDRGGKVTVTATVTNDEAVPGETVVAVTRDGQRVSPERVAVGPGEQRTVTSRVAMPESGDHRVGVEGNEVAVRVRERAAGSATPSGSTTSTEIPGFGATAGIGALVAAAAAVRRRSAE